MHSHHTRPVVVIGSGLAGLSAACVLAARGYNVTVLEKNSWVGGKAAVLEAGGFRFDMGPTILTIPSVLRRVFAEAGFGLEERLPMVRLDPQWRCFFDDGGRLDLVESAQSMAERLRTFSQGNNDAEGYLRFLNLSKELHSISDRLFFWRSVGGISDVLDLPSWFTPQGWRDFLKIRPGQSVYKLVRQHIKDPRTAQMLDHFVQYVGSSPEESPAVLCGIAHMQTREGIWYPIGGTRAVPVALEKLARELGVEFRTQCSVRKILVAGQAVSGVQLESGEEISVQAVVSNMDAVRTFRELLPPSRLTQEFERRRTYVPACSGVVLYLGLKRRYPELLHHDFVFSRSPEEEFEAIYRQGRPAPDPTLYLAATAATEPQVAPPGGEALYVLAHTPYLRPHHDWTQMLPGYRQVILDKLKRTAGLHDIEENIVFEAHLTPQDIHDRYAVLQGAIYGLASHGTLGAFKPSNRTGCRGLYLTGGSAHPGPGMPMVLMSGWIAADSLDKDRVAVRQAAPGGLKQTV